ncbi:MAG: hypothetical protein GF307_13740, partial [candidate division Zixibacteria bacterium]|nr:hypothetical protein [candidate division Zixibacteria bacterium]
MNRYLIAILLVLVIGANVYGATTFSAFRHEMHALGMGDAYLAHGRTVTSFLYNPAMLARNTG